MLGCRLGSQWGPRERQPHTDVSLPFSLPSPLSKEKKNLKEKRKHNPNWLEVGRAPGMALQAVAPSSLLAWPSSVCLCHPHAGCKVAAAVPGISSSHSCIQRDKRNFLSLELSGERKLFLEAPSPNRFSLSHWPELSHMLIYEPITGAGSRAIVISLDQGFLFFVPSIPWSVL